MPSKAWLKLSARGCLAAAAALPERLRAPLLLRVSAFLLLSADELLPPGALFFPEALFEGLFEEPFEEPFEELFEELFEGPFEELSFPEALVEELFFSSVLFSSAALFISVSAIKNILPCLMRFPGSEALYMSSRRVKSRLKDDFLLSYFFTPPFLFQ